MGLVLDPDPVDSLHPAYQDMAEALENMQSEPWGDGRQGPVKAWLGRRLDPLVGRLETNSTSALKRDFTEACSTGHALRVVGGVENAIEFTKPEYRSYYVEFQQNDDGRVRAIMRTYQVASPSEDGTRIVRTWSGYGGADGQLVQSDARLQRVGQPPTDQGWQYYPDPRPPTDSAAAATRE